MLKVPIEPTCSKNIFKVKGLKPFLPISQCQTKIMSKVPIDPPFFHVYLVNGKCYCEKTVNFVSLCACGDLPLKLLIRF